jgi:carboxyl-terminal processing protease
MITKRNYILAIASYFILSGVAFFTGYLARAVWPPAGEELALVREAKRMLEQYYLDPLPADVVLERGMVHGMVDTLGDPFTTYVEPAAHELQKDDLSGEYGGVGAMITRDEAGFVHLIPFENSPAERAGILEEDVLLGVDDLRIEPDTSLEEISAAIRGPVGTEVLLLLAKPGDVATSFEVRIERETIPLPSVTAYIYPDDPSIGVIAISLFSEKTQAELEKAFDELRDKGMKSLVLDLRGNSGGLLDSGIEVARFFLDTGLVVKEMQAGGKIIEYHVEDIGDGATIEMVALVNGGTASAAEVVAAALQANDRAPLIGQKTFGKGSVQVVIELSDNSSLHITSARWLTPNGSTLDQIGLEPDIPLEQDDVTDTVLQEAIRILRQHAKGWDEGELN